MALFKNILPISETENVKNLLPSKQYGVNKSQSVRKKALQDVGNTLHQKSIQRASKPSGYVPKPQIKKKSLSSEVKSTNENSIKQEDGKHSLILRTEDISDLEENNMEPVCNCDKSEGDFGDFMLKNIQLTKKQIEDSALIWENPPTVGIDDIRKVDLKELEIPEPEFLEFGWDSVLENLPEINLGNTEVPPVCFETSLYDGSFDCGIGL